MIKDIINSAEFKIETSRLLLVPISEKYAYDYFIEFDAEITKYQYPEPFITLESTKEFIEDFTGLRECGTNLVCCILDKENNFIGSIEIHMLDTKTPEIGLWIRKSGQCQGYGYEAITGLINFFRKHMDIDYFIYEADRRNPNSIKLVKALGGVEVGFNQAESNGGNILELNVYHIK
ncbi:MAG: GNAT family N-acetyltransferase [Clostridium sp.]